MEILDVLEEDEVQIGIGPIGRLLVVLLGLIGLVYFLNPLSTSFDLVVGMIIAISIPIALVSGSLYRWPEEYELPKTVILGVIGSIVVSIGVTIAYTAPSLGIITFSTMAVLALPPIFEELIFRVGLFLTFQEVVGTTIAILLQAAVFSAYHFITRNLDPVYAVVLFFGGIVFQVIVLMSHNILSSMIAHTIVNLKPILFTLLLSPFVIFAVGLGLLITIWRRRSNG